MSPLRPEVMDAWLPVWAKGRRRPPGGRLRRILTPPLRALVATPRWHRIHHASEARLQLSNFGMHFTIWDRMFGTYTDPQSAPSDFRLGLSDKRDPVPTIIGL